MADKGIEIEKENNLELPKNDEFNGKMFYYLVYRSYSELSSIYLRNFYFINFYSKFFYSIN